MSKSQFSTATGTLSAMVLCTMGCFPYWGKGKAPLPDGAIVFVDARTQETVSPILLVPRYSRFLGVSSGAGHGPGGGSDSCYLAHPIIYDGSDDLTIPDSRALGIVWFFAAYTGGSRTLDGIVGIAHGYRAKWFGPHETRVELEAVSDSEGKAEMTRIRALLSQDALTGDDADLWSYCGGRIEVQLDQKAKKLIEHFLSAT